MEDLEKIIIGNRCIKCVYLSHKRAINIKTGKEAIYKLIKNEISEKTIISSRINDKKATFKTLNSLVIEVENIQNNKEITDMLNEKYENDKDDLLNNTITTNYYVIEKLNEKNIDFKPFGTIIGVNSNEDNTEFLKRLIEKLFEEERIAAVEAVASIGNSYCIRRIKDSSTNVFISEGNLYNQANEITEEHNKYIKERKRSV